MTKNGKSLILADREIGKKEKKSSFIYPQFSTLFFVKIENKMRIIWE